jgi:UDP-N-acetylmuramoyl-L-alanyl-D-glutamate--2,6-diaminopimelate ligase
MISKLKKLIPGFVKVLYHKFRFLISSIKCSFPQKKLKLIGATGSSGKSTTSFMLYHILKESGKNVGLISTVGAYLGDKSLDTGLHVTTPDAHNIPPFFNMMLKEGAEYVVVEVSSHALAQGRLGNLSFDTSVFTNITSDHLDWHKTWENYATAKSKLVDMTKKDGLVVINKDDIKSYDFLKNKLEKRDRKYEEFSLKEVKNISSTLKQSFMYDNQQFNIPVIGSYNVSNALGAIKACAYLGVNTKDASNALETFNTLPGHMEVLGDENKRVILDFAHNTDSLEKSLVEVKNLTKEGKVISLFGSAGLRDVKKRYDMGLVAGKLSDIVIVVPEDPRIESLEEINDEIIRGCKDSNMSVIKRFSTHDEYLKENIKYVNSDKGVFAFDYEEVQARIDGIELGLKLLKKDDILITQGKGHEQSMCFGKTEYDYDEKKVINNLLKNIK